MDRNARKIRLVAPDIVALRKESVDRNIAITPSNFSNGVALRKESVDRNASVSTHCQAVPRGRSPQGERG